MTKTAFIGLGVMGYPMAGHTAAKSHEVTVFNRTAAKADKWVKEHGGNAAVTPREAAEGAHVVCACVGNDDDLRSITYGEDGILAGMKEGAIFVDHTTASADVAREIADKAAGMGLRFIDGPVSGGQAGAENGQLTVMCGGDSATFDDAKPIMDCYAQAVTLLGPVGSGQLCKMVNQICIAGLVQSLAEGVNFGAKAGLDMNKVIEVISKGAAQSWQMENRAHTMINDKFDFGFAVDWMRKDLSICFEEARNNGARLPVTALVDQFYAGIQAKDGNRWDTSSLLRNLTQD